MSFSASDSVSPTHQRDIRSAARSFKRDKDASEKWSLGARPAPGIRFAHLCSSEPLGGTEAQRAGEQVRPRKPFSQVGNPVSKSHANKNPKPTSHSAKNHFNARSPNNRLDRKVDAVIEANDTASAHLSKSLLELLPQHVNNVNTPIQIALRNADADTGVLYSYDNKGAARGSVALDGLVEKAEEKWKSEQTDRLVKGEYEVLDNDGEITALKGKKKSPKQTAAMAQTKDFVEEDDDFELV